MKEVPRLIVTKHCFFYFKISKLQSSHYRNVSTDPSVTGRGSLGIRGPHFEKHRIRLFCFYSSNG